MLQNLNFVVFLNVCSPETDDVNWPRNSHRPVLLLMLSLHGFGYNGAFVSGSGLTLSYKCKMCHLAVHLSIMWFINAGYSYADSSVFGRNRSMPVLTHGFSMELFSYVLIALQPRSTHATTQVGAEISRMLWIQKLKLLRLSFVDSLSCHMRQCSVNN